MKKNDKIIILLAIILAFSVLTWIVAGGGYTDGVFASSGISRAGIFDMFLLVCQAFYVRATDIFYIFTIGGFYGVASRTKAYRKLVSKTSSLIKGKENVALLVVTFILGVFTSISSDIYSLLFIMPFIITIFLRRGCDRLTALSAAFGGLFIGMFGQTFGTYAYSYLLESTSMTVKDGILFKIIMFVIAYVLYNFFAIMHMSKHAKSAEYVKFDMFPITKLDESGTSKSLRKKVWPTIVLFCLGLIVVLLAFINWNTSFNVTVFDTALDKINNFEVLGIPLFGDLLGNFTSFGNWDILGVSFILLIMMVIMVIADKMSIGNMCSYFGNGAKKISRVAFIYMLVNALFLGYYYFTWPITFANIFLGTKSFNVFGALFGSIINGAFAVDFEYASFMIQSLISTVYVDHLLDAALTIRFAYSMVNLIAPTSCILMFALSYLDISYGKWLKYIWKFALIMLIAGTLGLLIVSYV